MVPVLVPPERLNTTVDPPAVRLLLLESRAVKVRVILAPELTVAEDTLTKELAKLIAPGVTVTVGKVEVTETPPMVPVMVVADPAVTPVKLAV